LNKIVHATFKGRKHEKDGLPCQDKTYELYNNGVSCLSLSDGAGSAKHSDLGADISTKVACRYMCENFDSIISNNNALEIKQAILKEINDALSQQATEADIDLTELAATLLCVAVKDEKYIIFHIGDGVIGYAEKDVIKVASKPINGEYINSTVFITTINAAEHAKLLRGNTEKITGFILMSDGTAESFYNRKKKILAPVLVNFIKKTALLEKEKIQQLIKNSFLELVLKKTQDDCSIGIMSIDVE